MPFALRARMMPRSSSTGISISAAQLSTARRALASTRQASRPSCATMPAIEHGSRRRRARSWHCRPCRSCLAATVPCTVPVLAGFADHGPVWILQIDAHIDWRDEVNGERYGYSSPIRRASEMPHVAGIVQVGLRSVGSARLADVEAAQHYGSRFVTAREVHAQGVEAALRHIPEGGAGRCHARLRQPRSQHRA